MGIPNTEEKFWSKVKKIPGGCWLWQGAPNGKGNGKEYGRFSWDGKENALAHRVSYAIVYNKGKLPPKPVLICHTCDIPQCVNPDHLYTGTHKTNMKDKVTRGRHKYGFCQGEKQWNSKLTEEQVKQIFQAEGSYTKIAIQFGIARPTVYRIKNKERWKHIHENFTQTTQG
jgi:hypothetical protein